MIQNGHENFNLCLRDLVPVHDFLHYERHPKELRIRTRNWGMGRTRGEFLHRNRIHTSRNLHFAQIFANRLLKHGLNHARTFLVFINRGIRVHFRTLHYWAFLGKVARRLQYNERKNLVTGATDHIDGPVHHRKDFEDLALSNSNHCT